MDNNIEKFNGNDLISFVPCTNCPIPQSPFDPMLCLDCADVYCKTYSNWCGQNCPGCRAKVIDQEHNIMKIPTVPHNRCGKYHPIGTPCPDGPQSADDIPPNVNSNKKIPTVPHSKCGKFHPVGTPCPIMMVVGSDNKPKMPIHPHNKCGQFHLIGTPCPIYFNYQQK